MDERRSAEWSPACLPHGKPVISQKRIACRGGRKEGGRFWARGHKGGVEERWAEHRISFLSLLLFLVKPCFHGNMLPETGRQWKETVPNAPREDANLWVCGWEEVHVSLVSNRYGEGFSVTEFHHHLLHHEHHYHQASTIRRTQINNNPYFSAALHPVWPFLIWFSWVSVSLLISYMKVWSSDMKPKKEDFLGMCSQLTGLKFPTITT